MTIAGQQPPPPGPCYIISCCCSPGAAPHWEGGAGRSVCREPGQCQAGQSAGHCRCRHNKNSALQPQYNEGQPQPDMVLDTSSHLWNGVSGVPGLGVSIPRSLSSSRPVSSLDEWDRHDRRQPVKKESQVGSRSSAGMSSFNGVKVDIPRVLSPRSSSCRSSGRSTGSRGSSALSQGLSNGSSASSSKYSNRLVSQSLSLSVSQSLSPSVLLPIDLSLLTPRYFAGATACSVAARILQAEDSTVTRVNPASTIRKDAKPC